MTGGYIYRGPDPSLQGKYIFADFISAQIWMFDPASPYGTVTNITSLLEPDVGNANLFTTFGEDSAGNLYIATITGNVFRLLTDAVVPGDFQEDGNVDINDLAIWHEQFGVVGEPGEYDADANNSGRVNGRDFLIWQRNAGYSAVDPPDPDPVGDPAGQFVPEPQGGLLLMIALAMYGVPRLRRAASSWAV